MSLGHDAALSSVKEGRASVCILASDSSERLKDEFISLCEKTGGKTPALTHEAAKDFDIQSKDLIELVSKYFDGEKKYQTALEEKELDLVFDLLSKQNAPKSLDGYFARQKSAEDVKETPQKSAAESKKTASKADAGKTKQNAKTDNSAPFKSKKEKKEKDPSKPMQSRTKGEMRHVDTRGNSQRRQHRP